MLRKHTTTTNAGLGEGHPPRTNAHLKRPRENKDANLKAPPKGEQKYLPHKKEIAFSFIRTIFLFVPVAS